MSIISKLEKAQSAVAKDIANGSVLELADRVGKAAIKAITHGLGSKEGKAYMALFCDSPNELAQMTTPRGTDGNYMAQVRAYSAANAICTIDTGTQLSNGVRGRDIEPPAGAVVPEGLEAPAEIRDNALFEQLQQG